MTAEHKWDYSFDVVVVGSGLGGMTAALCAYEMGVKDGLFFLFWRVMIRFVIPPVLFVVLVMGLIE